MPDWKKIVQERLASLRMEAGAEASLADEITQHLEDRYRELRSGGASEDGALETVLTELADIESLQAGIQRNERLPKRDPVPQGDARRANLLEDLWRDLRYAIRNVRKNPAFVLFVVLTLALGIGANSTVFTVINTLILNPLPVPYSDQLFAITTSAAAGTSTARSNHGAPQLMSYADFKDYAAGNETVRSMAAYTGPRVMTWHSGSASERMFAEFVTARYFSTLEIEPAKGRFFFPEEDGNPGAHPVAVMNYGTWQTRFGGSPDIVGKTLRLNNDLFTVIGIAPPHFIGVNALFGPDFWIPAAMAEPCLPTEMHNVLTDRSKQIFMAAARWKPTVTQAQAQANLAGIAAALARQYPQTNEGRTVTVCPIRDVLFVYSFGSANPIVYGSGVLLIVVGIVLLIACSNVANLLLARSAARQQEIAVRLAMGASRGRLIRQLLTESVLLGFLAGAVGLSIACYGIQALWSFLPSASNFIAPKLDATVFLYAAAISIVTGFLFGIIPAFHASRASVSQALQEEARAAGRSHRRVTLANALLAGQMAFSFLLLVTAGLFLRSIQRAYDMDPGFQTAHLGVFMTNPGQAGYGNEQTKAFYREVRERVQAMPGVESVSWASNLPLWARSLTRLQIEGRQERSQADQITTILNSVDLRYFETAGVPIDRGREFTNLDQKSSLPVAIVNEKLAQDYWPRKDPLGKRVQLPDENFLRVIVGVARTANYTTLGEPPQYCVYLPLEQRYSDAMNLFVRSSGDPNPLLLPVAREIRAAGPEILTSSNRTGREIVDNGLFGAKMGVGLLSVFGLLALTLACIGLYGIMAYSVAQRKREIGLRMALGAAQSSVLGLVLKQGMSLVLIGMLIGFGAVLLVSRLLAHLLYGVAPTDLLSVVGAAVVLLVVAFLACYLPARSASRVDPLVALREG